MAWPLASCGQPGAHLQRAVAAAAHAQPQPLLLCGPSQSGKTRLAHSLAAALACPLHACSAGRLAVSHPGRPDAGLTAAFVSAALAARAAPSRAAVLLLDGLDALLGAREARASDGDWDALRAFALGCAALAAQQHLPEEAAEGGAAGGAAPPRVWVVATCTEPAALHAQALAQFSAPGSVVRLGPPAPSERGTMLLAALRGTPGLRTCAAAVEAEAGALAGVAEGGAHGFLAGDLAAVAQDLALALAGARDGASPSSECGAAAGPSAAPPSLCSLLRSLVAGRTPLLLVLGEGASGRGGGYSGAGGGSAAGRELAGALRGAGWQLPAAVTDVQDFRGAAALAASGAGGHLVRGTTAAAAAAAAAEASASASDPGAGGGGGGGAGAPMASLLSGLAAALRPTLPAVAWQDVKGQAAAKASLQQLLRLSSASAPAAASAPSPAPSPAPAPPAPRPSGILLYGPPGTGKTLLAKAAATALGARFINVSIPSVLRAGLGDSEAALARAFDLARATAPSLVFMDEVQALFGARGGGGGGEEDADTARLAANLTATLLHCLDAVRGCGVTVLAATNVPSALDAGLLRPGRLDRAVYVGLPSSGDRRELLAGVVAGVQCSGGGSGGGGGGGGEEERGGGACGGAGEGVRSAAALLELLVAATEGFSGADCAALGRRAAGVAVRRSGALAELLRSVYGGSGSGSGGSGGGAGGRAAEGAECVLTPSCFFAALHGDEEGGLRAMAPSVSREAEAAVKGWRRAR